MDCQSNISHLTLSSAMWWCLSSIRKSLSYLKIKTNKQTKNTIRNNCNCLDWKNRVDKDTLLISGISLTGLATSVSCPRTFVHGVLLLYSEPSNHAVTNPSLLDAMTDSWSSSLLAVGVIHIGWTDQVSLPLILTSQCWIATASKDSDQELSMGILVIHIAIWKPITLFK